MSSVTSLTPLPYPDPTDQPFVHLDLKALAEATTESLYVNSETAPAHKVGRRWIRTSTGSVSISDGTTWRPVPFAEASGIGSQVFAGANSGVFNIALPAGRFTQLPQVFVSVRSTSLGVFFGAVASSTTNITVQGFQGAAALNVPYQWYAVQMLGDNPVG